MYGRPTYFGGLDLGKRIDASAFVLLEHRPDGILIQKGQKTWDGVNYKTVAEDMLKIQRKYRMFKLCFDRTGVGDAAQELFSKEIPMEEVITSLPVKIEIINFLHSLFQNKRLIIKDKTLYDQVLEQEKHISEAGNEIYRHPSNRHDDVFWALGYACFAAKPIITGIPNYTMSRTGIRMLKKTNSFDEDLKKLVGPGWDIR